MNNEDGYSSSSLEENFNNAGGENQGHKDDDEDFENFQSDPKRMYSELKKTQRLLSKQQKFIEQLQNQPKSENDHDDIIKKLSQVFGGKSDDNDSGNKLSYLDKAKQADAMWREKYGQGLDLTVEGAEHINQLMTENKKMKEQLEQLSSFTSDPQNVAQNLMFVNVENGLKERLTESYGSEDLADTNYPDYERVAIEMLGNIKKTNSKAWNKLIASQAKQKEFIESVVEKKMPNFSKVKGWQKIEDYSIADAKKDLDRADELAKKGNRAEASRLQEKARQRFLEEQVMRIAPNMR